MFENELRCFWPQYGAEELLTARAGHGEEQRVRAVLGRTKSEPNSTSIGGSSVLLSWLVDLHHFPFGNTQLNLESCDVPLIGKKLATSFHPFFDEIPCVYKMQTWQCANLKAAANGQLCTIVLLIDQNHFFGAQKLRLARPRCPHGGFRCSLQAEAKFMHWATPPLSTGSSPQTVWRVFCWCLF